MNARILFAFATVTLVLGGFALARLQDQPEQQPSGEQAPPATGAGFLGAKFAAISDEIAKEMQLDSTDGVIVMEVIPGSPAQAGGMQAHDIIRKMDDAEINDVPDLQAKMRSTKPGQEMTITVMRDKESKELKITLGTRPTTMPS